MPGLVKSVRPSVEAQMQFNLLTDLYDKGRGLDKNARIEIINKFLAVSNPGVESQLRWGVLKGNRAESIVNLLRWGLKQFREGKPFMRSGPPDEDFLTGPKGFKEDGLVWDQRHGRAVRVGSRDPEVLFVTRAFELLTEVAPWLRVCKREDCQKFFLFQRPKQVYCSDVCAQRDRMQRFLARRTPNLRRK